MKFFSTLISRVFIILLANILRKYSIERFNYTRYLNTSNILSFRVLCTHESSRGLQIETSMKKSRKRFVNEKQNGKQNLVCLIRAQEALRSPSIYVIYDCLYFRQIFIAMQYMHTRIQGRGQTLIGFSTNFNVYPRIAEWFFSLRAFER